MPSVPRRRALLASFSTTILLGGCLTSKLPPPNSYEESFDTMLVSQDGKKLAIIGRQFHYIFDVPPELSAILHTSFRNQLSASFWGFTVAPDNSISGYVRLELEKYTPAQLGELHSLGQTSTVLVVQPVGQRFIAGKTLALPVTDRLNRSYTVRVTEAPGAVTDASSNSRATNALLSPITQAADGVLFFGAAVVATPILLVMRPRFGF